MLGVELPDSVLILDDGLARRVADSLGLHFSGTLGLLLDAKRAGLIPAVSPLVDQLQALRFRVAPHTRRAVLALAGE
jgi:predicted nucleic acid-binding protein